MTTGLLNFTLDIAAILLMISNIYIYISKNSLQNHPLTIEMTIGHCFGNLEEAVDRYLEMVGHQKITNGLVILKNPSWVI